MNHWGGGGREAEVGELDKTGQNWADPDKSQGSWKPGVRVLM